jgi:hypothetical protein
MTPIPQAAIEAMKDDIKRQIKESLGAYFGDEADGASIGIEGVIDLGRLVSAALPHLGEPVAWQYHAGIDGWKQCPPEVVACYRRQGMIVRPIYLAPPTPTVKVKPLEWDETEHLTTDDDSGPREGLARKLKAWRAGYVIIKQDGAHGRLGLVLPALDDAKAAAQADHNCRVLAEIEGGGNA